MELLESNIKFYETGCQHGKSVKVFYNGTYLDYRHEVERVDKNLIPQYQAEIIANIRRQMETNIPKHDEPLCEYTKEVVKFGISLKTILMHNSVLKFAKEAEIALKQGRVFVGGTLITENIKLSADLETILEQGEFFYRMFGKFTYSNADLLKFKILYSIEQLFDGDHEWDADNYADYREMIEYCKDYISVKVGKKVFVLKKADGNISSLPKV